MGINELAGLIQVFEDAAAALRRPGNDFAWSGWADEAAALEEVGGIIRTLRSGSMPDKLNMEVLFAPTGPIQEVSLSSGWAYEFLRIAERFDTELSRALT